MDKLRFDNKVVVVTGGGAGLGRSYALLFASRGAKVVVNDLGGGRHGDGSSLNAADNVVKEIQKYGGIAVASYDSVVDGDKIIKTALDNFGGVDILINNAGILRDKSFARISDQDWDLIHNVHLKGSFKTTQAAFPIFKEQGYGRIIMTSSSAGLYGNFGQANYSAAKMGLIGLSNTLAIEGAKYNIHCNVIVPVAASRLTEDILPPALFNELKPELVAPFVAYMCHDSCEENGSIILTAAGYGGKVQIIRGEGMFLSKKVNANITIEDVAHNWNKIVNMTNPRHYASIGEELMSLVGDIDKINETAASKNKIITQEKSESVFTFLTKDLILYALGVGASTAVPTDLQYIYENHEKFTALPTFFILPAMQSVFGLSAVDGIIPDRSISLDQILHGEQYIEFLSDLPQDGNLVSKAKVVEILDKGSGAVVVYDVETFNEKGDLIVKNQTVVFIVGAGKFGGPRTGSKIIECLPNPNRKPDMSLFQKTSVDQAALYRLSGDLNPLHIDPDFAIIGGFKKPILHGLCTLGFSIRLLLRAYAADNPNLVTSIKARFVKPVIPGQTLRVDAWQEDNRIYFKTVVVDTNEVVIGGAYLNLKSVQKMVAEKNSSGNALQSDAIFEYIIEQINLDPSKGKDVNGIFLYNITKDGKQVKQWTMDLKNGIVYEGAPKEKPNTTLTISDEDFMEMATNKLNPQVAFMKGKLKITGNLMLAQKLGPILKANSKL